jgi:DNA (cytosine-5)-methyltransferase 1
MSENPGSALKAVDFFCGAGGMTCGMKQAGIEVLVGIDIDPSCKETYENNNKPSKFIEEDILALTPERLIELTGIEQNDDSLIFIGCSPCQYWTKIRTIKDKNEKTKNLLGGFRKFVHYFRPGYIVVENVPGLHRKRTDNILGEFLTFLKEESYKVLHDDVINTVCYGVPQSRERYLLIASRIGSAVEIPKLENIEYLTVRSFLGSGNGFYPIPAGYRDDSDFQHTAAGLSDLNMRRIMLTKPDGGTRYSWKDDPLLQIATYKGRDEYFRNVYGRMFWDKPAPTITTRFHSLSNGRFGHPEEHRAISLREGATLQTFPKNYKFFGSSIGSMARQIGNAVPPELARRIGFAIVQSYRNVKPLDMEG